MITPSLQRLRHLCDTVPPRLLALDDASFSARPAHGKWSGKEIVGHLIDSAANNHHRFVRGQFEDMPRITYDQNEWNAHNHYNEIDRLQLIRFWEFYNRQLLALLLQLTPAALSRTVETGGSRPLTIAALAIDYVAHMEHHLQQIFHPTT